ncbi:hypothetical protein PT274_00710 [Leuconostocaceae bacterium ESL0958]|nr:hypothetical protein [Leuconostocaceae bacterium ESL0958]
MQLSNQRFIKAAIENQVHNGSIVIEGHAGSGQATRLLSSLVGKDGLVMAFFDQKAAANETVSGLFMAGLQERTVIEQQALNADSLTEELGRFTRADVALLDYQTDGDRQADEAIAANVALLLSFLKESGLLVVNLPANQQLTAIEQEADLDWARYQTSQANTYLIEKQEPAD